MILGGPQRGAVVDCQCNGNVIGCFSLLMETRIFVNSSKEEFNGRLIARARGFDYAGNGTIY